MQTEAFGIWDAVRSEADKHIRKRKDTISFFVLLCSLMQGDRYGHQGFFLFSGLGKGGV